MWDRAGVIVRVCGMEGSDCEGVWDRGGVIVRVCGMEGE